MKTLKDIFNNIISCFLKLKAKKVIAVILALILLIVPTLLALGYVCYIEFFQKENYFSISLYDENDRLIVTEEDQPESSETSSLSSIFYTLLNEGSKKALEASPNTENKAYVRAVTSYKNTKNDIKCYFSETDKTGFFIDGQDKAYIIPERINKLFLGTDHAECFYKNSEIYSLKTKDLDTIIPKEVSWYYKNVNGEYASASLNKTDDNVHTYEITGAIDIIFEKRPDHVKVTVTEKNKASKKVSLDELSKLSVDSGSTLNIKIEAEWNKNDTDEKYGSATYDFSVKIKNRSEFSISHDTINAGEFTVLEGTNITDISKIIYTSEDKTITPVFFRDKDVVKALLCFPESDTEKSYSFTVTYGAASKDFTIKILPTALKGEISYQYAIHDNENAPNILNDKIKNELLKIKLSKNDLVYFQGNSFSNPTAFGFNEAYTHNSMVKWGETLNYSYTAFGNCYTVNSGNGVSVKTVGAGMVAATGNNSTLGKFVVVDHGCGLRSFYTNLSSIDVNKGDILVSEQIIGKTGSSILNEKEGFSLYCTVYDTIIDPNILWNTKNET